MRNEFPESGEHEDNDLPIGYGHEDAEGDALLGADYEEDEDEDEDEDEEEDTEHTFSEKMAEMPEADDPPEYSAG